jgi:hypothetical protein
VKCEFGQMREVVRRPTISRFSNWVSVMVSDPQSLPGGLRIVFVVFDSTARWRAERPISQRKAPLLRAGLRIRGLTAVHLDHSVGPIIGAFWSSPTIITQAPWRRVITAVGHRFTATCRGGITNSVTGTFCPTAPLATGPIGSSLARNTRRIMPTLCRCRAPNCR